VEEVSHALGVVVPRERAETPAPGAVSSGGEAKVGGLVAAVQAGIPSVPRDLY